MDLKFKLGAYLMAAVLLVSLAAGGRKSKELRAVQTAADMILDDSPTIVLDAGHGGADGGCVSVNGIPEKGINLSIATTAGGLLRVLGYNAVLTRERDESIHDSGTDGLAAQKRSDMKNRLAIINRDDAAAAVSIHQNQFTDEKYYGAQMFYKAEDPDSEALAESIRQQIVSRLQPENERELKPVGDELYLIHNAECPAVMVECGFLSNREEAAKLETAEYQQQVAFCTALGVIRFAGCGE